MSHCLEVTDRQWSVVKTRGVTAFLSDCLSFTDKRREKREERREKRRREKREERREKREERVKSLPSMSHCLQVTDREWSVVKTRWGTAFLSDCLSFTDSGWSVVKTRSYCPPE
jgi:hypothetical protein